MYDDGTSIAQWHEYSKFIIIYILYVVHSSTNEHLDNDDGCIIIMLFFINNLVGLEMYIANLFITNQYRSVHNGA